MIVRSLVLLLLLGVAGCGGGGSGSNPDTPRTDNRGEFTLSGSTISLVQTQGGTQPPTSQPLMVTLTGTNIATLGAAYRPGVPQAPWLDVSVSGSGTSYEVRFAPTLVARTMPLGEYSTTIAIGTADSSGNILQTRDVQVSLRVREGLRVTSNPAVANMTAGHSDSTRTLPFTVLGPAGSRWIATSNVAWLAGPTGEQSGPGEYELVVNSASLPPGHRQGQLTIISVSDPTDVATLPVSLGLSFPSIYIRTDKPHFTGMRALGGDSGLEVDPVPMIVHLDTGTAAHPFAATLTSVTGGDWLRSNVSNGTVSSSGTPVLLDADRTQLAPGVYQSNVRLTVTVNGAGLATDVPITLNFDHNRLLVTDAGVALSSFPSASRSVLTRTVRVHDTWRTNSIAWNASSNRDWLTVTSGGTTGGSLVIQANPQGLAADQVHEAEVTITSAAETIVNQQTVRVGLAVRSADPVDAPIDVAVSTSAIVASPVLPEIYVANRWLAIDVYDVHTGGLLRSLPFDGSHGLAISDDGRTLFANGAEVRAITVATGEVSGTYEYGLPIGGIRFARPDAHPVLILGRSASVDLATGEIMNSSPVVSAIGDISADHRYLYGLDLGYTDVLAYDMRYSRANSPHLRFWSAARNNGAGFTGNERQRSDIAASRTLDRVYVSSGPGSRIEVLSATDLSVAGSMESPMHPWTLETSWNGKLAVQSGGFGTADNLQIYDASGALRGHLDSGAREDFGALIFSGDGTRLITSAGAEIRIQSVP